MVANKKLTCKLKIYIVSAKFFLDLKMTKLILSLFCISTLTYATDRLFNEDLVFRAENYIVAGQFEKALEDLEKVHEVDSRIMLDLLITYAYLGDDQKALSATEHLVNLLDFPDSHTPNCLCKDEIFVTGPDKEPAPGWCEQTVGTTAEYLLKLVEKSKLGQYTKDSISHCLEQLQNSGLKCCARKEPWKGCVGPLAKRMVQWEAFGIPEDPKWD